MSRRLRREYRTVEIPSDCEGDPEKRRQLAFLQAEETFRIWRMPSLWRVVWDDGERIRVRRESRR